MPRRIATVIVVSALTVASGCSTVMSGLVGDRNAGQASQKSTTPIPFQGLAYSSNTIDSQSQPRLGTGMQEILPPTVPSAGPGEATEESESIGTAGPRPAIAVAPLTQNTAELTALGSAAAREAGKSKDTRFVLLVLTPPAADAAAISSNATQSRAAAAAALHAITAAGVAADRVEISGATAIPGGAGEMRLYVR